MNFLDAVKAGFAQYATFSGRALRSEYWWWTLFVLLGNIATTLVHEGLAALFLLATLVPYIAVAARRLHDIGKSGWWQLIGLVPLIGWIIMIVWCAKEGEGDNAFGPAITVA